MNGTGDANNCRYWILTAVTLTAVIFYAFFHPKEK